MAKCNKTVLQLDLNDLYGEKEATLSFQQMQKCNKYSVTASDSFKPLDFRIDLSPKLLLGNGTMSKYLLQTGVAEYLEFKPVSGIFYSVNSSAVGDAAFSFVKLPLNKQEIFLSSDYSFIEKRTMMKFIQQIAEESVNLSLLPCNLQNATSLCFHLDEFDNETNATEFMRKFVLSCGKFSSTPYLYSMFGSSEILQSFIRLSAVNGALQILKYTEHLCKRIGKLDVNYVHDELKDNSPAVTANNPTEKNRMFDTNGNTTENVYIFKETQSHIKAFNVISKKQSSERIFKKNVISKLPLLAESVSIGYCKRNEKKIFIFQSKNVAMELHECYCKSFL